MPSKANDTAATVQHALRLVKVYELANIPRRRVCIKIPSTVEGIAACEELEQQHDVRTLATTCFTVAQGLAAAKANCTYVAPYVNPLIVHLDPSKHTVYDDPLPNLTGLQVSFAIQQEYRKMQAKTKVLAARCVSFSRRLRKLNYEGRDSLVTAEEVFALCGIEHITLSAAALALIQKTEMDDRFEGIRDRSLAFARSDLSGPFFGSDLTEALADPAVDALQKDALKHFTSAEEELRSMAKQKL
jgi:transaldolase